MRQHWRCARRSTKAAARWWQPCLAGTPSRWRTGRGQSSQGCSIRPERVRMKTALAGYRDTLLCGGRPARERLRGREEAGRASRARATCVPTVWAGGAASARKAFRRSLHPIFAAMVRSRQSLTKAPRGPFLALCARLEKTPALFSLRRSETRAYRDQFAALLARHTKGSPIDLGREPFAEFVKQCKKYDANLPKRLRAALSYRTKKADSQRRTHARLVSKLGLGPASEAAKLAAFQNVVPTIHLRRLKKAYPDLFKWVCESPETKGVWEAWVNDKPLSDKRHSRREMMVEDPEQLAYIVAADQNAIIRDSDTGEIICVVIRDFCADIEVVAWVSAVVAEAVGLKRSVRASVFYFLCNSWVLTSCNRRRIRGSWSSSATQLVPARIPASIGRGTSSRRSIQQNSSAATTWLSHPPLRYSGT